MKFPLYLATVLAVMGIAGEALSAENNKVGAMFKIQASDLPAPYATPIAALVPRVISSNREGELNLPEGFKVTAFRRDLTHARWLEVLENGDVLLAQPRAGEITLLRDANGDGIAEIEETVVADLDRPHGMAIVGDWLYIGEPTQVRRVKFKVGDTKARGPIEFVTEKGSLGDGGGHWTRNLLYDAADDALYISVGSAA
ncbi:MAG: hypothetical protein COB93_04060, partial [Sneathiella sp.]